MILTVNGQSREVKKTSDLRELLKTLDIPTEGIAVSVNSEVVPHSRLKERRVRPGDRVEIVRAVGGG